VQERLTRPFVAYVLLAVTVILYLLQMASEAFLGTDLPALLGMKINEYILAGQVWRFFTPALLHGSIMHIAFNMYALAVIGAPLEQRFGHGRFLALYTAGAFSGNVFSFLLSADASLGASTAIFGLLGAEIVFFYQNRRILGSRARAALQNVLTIAGINLLIGLSPGIDNWGHLGGLAGGLLFTWFAGPQLLLEGMYPSFTLTDERGESASLFALALVFAFFGALALLKFGGIFAL
jgi:rhomboid protease GluP